MQVPGQHIVPQQTSPTPQAGVHAPVPPLQTPELQLVASHAVVSVEAASTTCTGDASCGSVASTHVVAKTVQPRSSALAANP